MTAVLCGGVGGSKLVAGLYGHLPPDSLDVIVNVSDDLMYWGLHVSPDLDTVMYTLAGLANPDTGWGVEGDTFHVLEMLARFGEPSWFRVGDRDLATHVRRTRLLHDGLSLGEVVAQMSERLGVRARIMPAADDPLQTMLKVGDEWLAFQEYFVQRRHRDDVTEIRYQGIEDAKPAPGVVEALSGNEIVVISSSNPALSILPILAIPGVRNSLVAASGVRVAMSPLIGDDSVSGPAGRLMSLLGQPASVVGLARLYRGIVDGVVIDKKDEDRAAEIEEMDIRVMCTDIMMVDDASRERLAGETLRFARSLR